MKRKMFLIVISILVLCLTCGMLFVACNDKNEGNDNNDDDHNTTTGSAFDTFKDVVFELEDVKLDTTGAKEFNFGLDVTAADDASKSLFSLAFETLGGEEYIYGSVNGGAMTKFNGFDLGGTVETVLSWFGDSISIMGIPVELNANGFLGGVGGELLSALIGDAKVSSDGSAYAIVLNLEGVVGLISGEEALLNLDQMIADAGLGDIFGMIIPAIGGLITPDGSDDASPATVTELVEAIADNYTLTFYFGFEDNTGKDAAAEKAAQPFGDLALSSKVMAAREADARNLLKFSVDGTVAGYDNQTEGEGEDAQVVSVNNHNYAINVDVDIDPFVLFGILDMVQGNGECLLSGVEINPAWKLSFNGTPEEIVALVKQMGGIDITVDEVDAEGNVIMNVLTLYYDGGDYAVAALQTHAALSMARLGMGGVYDVDALGEVIEMLITDGAAASDETGTPAEGGESGLDIMGIIQMVLACVDYDNIAVDGLTIDFATLVPEIVKLIIPETDGLFNTVNGAVMDILGSDSLNFKFGQFNFGTATIRPVEEVTGNLRMMGNYFGQEGMYNGLVYEITSIPGLENGAEIDLGSSITSGMTGANAGYSDIFVFNGTDFAGNAVQTSGIIMNTVGFDPNTLGTQNITVYVGVVTDFYFSLSTINQFMGDTPIVLDPMWPFFGVLKYETTIEVVEPSGLDATLQHVTDGTLSLVSGRSIAVVNDGVFMFSMAGTGALAQMHVIVWDAASSSLVVVDAITQAAIPGFEVTDITLTSSDVLPSPIGLTTGLAADPSSVVVGEGSAWLGFWGTAGTIQFELTYNGQPVIFNGVANNTFNYAVN